MDSKACSGNSIDVHQKKYIAIVAAFELYTRSPSVFGVRPWKACLTEITSKLLNVPRNLDGQSEFSHRCCMKIIPDVVPVSPSPSRFDNFVPRLPVQFEGLDLVINRERNRLNIFLAPNAPYKQLK